MGKRSYDTSDNVSTNAKWPPAKVQKTERSHEENQERAYIAASRRADRSLEARVQSAKMASEIHRKRTGRGLKVSEDIVLKEEMYEEMEDDTPRPYMYLTAHLQTGSSELNRRVNDFVTGKTAMASQARYNHVNKLFGEAFPHAASYSKQMHNSLYMAPFIKNRPPTPPLSASASSPASRNQSISTQSQYSNVDITVSNPSPGNTPTIASAPTPELSPAATSTDATETAGTPYLMPQTTFSNFALDPQLAQQSTSSFTSELPNEVKMMANIDMSDPMAKHFYGEDLSSAFQMRSNFGGSVPSHGQLETSDLAGHGGQKSLDGFDEAFLPSLDAEINYEDLPTMSENFGPFAPTTSDGTGTDGWESFLDFGNEQ
ncbi:hypothetical protein HD806DRAFT_300030 [Xylariaceae sp. AK1471]|nr:hypothetical protein HD806DRAFT_300030 [Xylariaceae sp. AK1471]